MKNLYAENLFNKQLRTPTILKSLIAIFLTIIALSFLITTSLEIDAYKIGYLILPLFYLSEVPLLINFFYILLSRIGFFTNQVLSLFSHFYPYGLIFHSVIFTMTLGVVFVHMMLLLHKAGYCVIFMILLIFLWLIEYFFWERKWPLVQSSKLYWLHWTIIFGLFIGLPFHADSWSLLTVTVFAPIVYGALFFMFVQDSLRFRSRDQKTKSSLTNII